MITMIWAEDYNGVIGNGNALPWKNQKGDMRFFKETTTGKTVLMGRKTFESMKSKPLPNRHNIVLTTRKGYDGNGAMVVNDIDDVLEMSMHKEIFVIGGREIYNLFMPYADRILKTKICGFFEGDTFSPNINGRLYLDSKSERHEADLDNAYPYVFKEYRKDSYTKHIDVYYVCDTTSERRLLATVEDMDTAMKHVNKFLDERNWVSPYWRWTGREGEEFSIDVGSWVESFELVWRKKHNC